MNAMISDFTQTQEFEEEQMARAGRKAKQGKREPSGKLSRKGRARRPLFDHGTERTIDKISLYGTDGSDAIGRAYVCDLLGENGDMLRDAARAIHRTYWPMLGVGVPSSSLGERISGGVVADVLDPDERDRLVNREYRLTSTLRKIDAMGRAVRLAFDQLCIDINPDCGPAWLDRLILCRKAGEEPMPADSQTLARALEALAVVAAGQHRKKGSSR